MLKACSRCGKMHPLGYKCRKGIKYSGGEEREFRGSSLWQRKREEIKDKANWLCEVCRDKGIYTLEDLEVHHIDKIVDAPEERLDNLNLICLCVTHHKEADAGKLSNDYLRKLAEIREERYSPEGFH